MWHLCQSSLGHLLHVFFTCLIKQWHTILKVAYSACLVLTYCQGALFFDNVLVFFLFLKKKEKRKEMTEESLAITSTLQIFKVSEWLLKYASLLVITCQPLLLSAFLICTRSLQIIWVPVCENENMYAHMYIHVCMFVSISVCR